VVLTEEAAVAVEALEAAEAAETVEVVEASEVAEAVETAAAEEVSEEEMDSKEVEAVAEPASEVELRFSLSPMRDSRVSTCSEERMMLYLPKIW
jgi:hypothetical protein